MSASDPLSGLDFLIGNWHSNSPGAKGSDVFQRELDGHILQRRSQSASTGNAATSMQALLTVYATGAGDALAAIYFDNEGHVIRYNHVTVKPETGVEFSSDTAGPLPAFRLAYSVKGPGLLHVKFETAAPGQKDYRLIAEADEAATH